ncbi:MAG: alpha/beta hydrolase [Desulforegulaceae bacterium]|nr:alpha/beta hydrolase [Desulforegulaceae bacterium]
MSSDFKEINFYSEKFSLSGYLHIPKNFSNSIVIGSHGLLSDAQSMKQINLAKRLSDYNIGYLRFNHRGCSTSQGKLENTNLLTRKTDIISAFEYLKTNYNIKKTGLFGSSMGGAACICSHDEIKPQAMVLVASPVLGKTMKNSFSNSIDILMKETGLSRNFFEKNIDFDLSGDIDKIKNSLVIHGDNDEIVPFENGEILYSNLKNDKKMIRIKNGDHRITSPKDQNIMIDETVNWFVKYLN